MRSYLSLIPISAKVRRRQNRMTILCIIFAVFLVTAVFSMADMAVRMEANRRINKDGNWHIMLKNIDEITAEEIGARDDVAAFSRFGSINSGIDKDYYINGKKTAICGVDQDMESILPGFDAGTYPADGEAVLTENMKSYLQVETGDTIALTMPDGSSESFTISGFNHDTSDASKYDAAVLFVNYDTFQEIQERTNEPADLQYYVRFTNRANLRNTISDIRERYHLSDENIGENAYLLATSGASDNTYILGLYGVAAVLAVLIVLAGVFMIAGSLNSNVAERTVFFGMLRCLGASKAQIRKLVRLEALSWCKTAIPVGIVSGVTVTWGLCAFLKFYVGSEFEAIPQFGVSIAGIVSGLVIGTATVLLAASSPARKAAQVSPMAAVSQNTMAGKKYLTHGRQFYGKIELALGRYHATASKKNMLLMTGSFALSIVLFLSFSVVLSWVHAALNPLAPYAPDLSISDSDGGIDSSLAAELEEKSMVKRAFGRMYQQLPAFFEGHDSKIDLISYEEYQFTWAKGDLTTGRLPTKKGEVLTVFDKSNSLQVGDIIELDGTTLTVVGVLDDSPFSADEFPTVICLEQTFVSLMGASSYAVVDIQLADGATDSDVNELRHMIESKTGDKLVFSDRRESNRDVENTYWAFTLFVYAFLAVIALITVLNIVNSISLSVSARIRQYGYMRAVGMDVKQVTMMIVSETITYGISGLVAGCALGLPLNRFLFHHMVTNYFGTLWKIPWNSLFMITAIVVLSVVAAVRQPAKRIRNMAITDTINEL